MTDHEPPIEPPRAMPPLKDTPKESTWWVNLILGVLIGAMFNTLLSVATIRAKMNTVWDYSIETNVKVDAILDLLRGL